jgi:hypothetical protein
MAGFRLDGPFSLSIYPLVSMRRVSS